MNTMVSPAKALRYGSLAGPSLVSGEASSALSSATNNLKSLRRSLGNGYVLDLTETIPHVIKDGHKLVRNCSTGKTVCGSLTIKPLNSQLKFALSFRFIGFAERESMDAQSMYIQIQRGLSSRRSLVSIITSQIKIRSLLP